MGKVDVVLDGRLFAECQIRANNRDGMMRLAEEVTHCLHSYDDLNLSFASNIKIEKYDKNLKQYVYENYGTAATSVISQGYQRCWDILKWKSLFKHPILKKLVTPNYHLNNKNIYHSFYHPFDDYVTKQNLKKSITFLDIIPLVRAGYNNKMVSITQNIVNAIKNNYAIAISEYSKNDLLNYDKSIRSDQVFVAPLAASPKLFYNNVDAYSFEKIKAKYQIPHRYILTVSGSDKRKNIRNIIKGFNEFILQNSNTDIKLLVTGNLSHSMNMLNELKITSFVRSKIVMPSTFIDTKDLAIIYSNAICFIFLSYYEGFGLPVLEAMQCGTPVISSNKTSLPEVVGSSGLLVDPDNIIEIAEALDKLCNNEHERNHFATLGIKRAQQFSWEKTAELYHQFFHAINER
ncbi:glycosyltransferase family 4 protein [Ferruginibacter yonginensis]|uniref:Glycosyltransferase family 4 protein n=1 Tax=Ferruginibacter yonginensis TaxID=1310416 RepID=A0ABV8QRX9_9BACT